MKHLSDTYPRPVRTPPRTFPFSVRSLPPHTNPTRLQHSERSRSPPVLTIHLTTSHLRTSFRSQAPPEPRQNRRKT